MKKYYLIERQSGGCDYTIGCGLRITRLSGGSIKEAVEEAIGDLVYSYKARHESGIDFAEIIEVTNEINLHDGIIAAQKKLAEIKKRKARKKKETEDRAKYEKLKKRFG